jgi:hypothetical protein
MIMQHALYALVSSQNNLLASVPLQLPRSMGLQAFSLLEYFTSLKFSGHKFFLFKYFRGKIFNIDHECLCFLRGC